MEVLTEEKPSIKTKLLKIDTLLEGVEKFLASMTKHYESIRSGVEPRYMP
jgi:hypothetical protein